MSFVPLFLSSSRIRRRANLTTKVLGSGYKNLQSAARASHRRARLTAGGNANGSVDLTANGSSYTDDSALGDEEYGDSNSNSDCYEYGDNYPQTSQIHSQDGKVAHSRQGSRSYTQQGMMMGVGGATNGLNGMTANGYGYAMQGGGHMMRGQAGLGNGRDMGIGSIINGASGGV